MKYNSNSGFIDNEYCRKTPQAFSHFTFERSGHELMVVDIQGVGDLYTDPQIHTATGTEYNDGKSICCCIVSLHPDRHFLILTLLSFSSKPKHSQTQ